MDIPRLSYRDYKNRAENCLSKSGVCSDSLPVDIELVIDSLGINIVPFQSLYRNYGVKGMVVKRQSTQGFDIVIDEKHWFNDECYYKFTLAEELAHILVHSCLFASVSTEDDLIRLINSIPDGEYHKMEQQAHNIASFLLLPDELFRKYTLSFVEENKEDMLAGRFYEKADIANYLGKKLEQ